jgi:hypothetical protein
MNELKFGSGILLTLYLNTVSGRVDKRGNRASSSRASHQYLRPNESHLFALEYLSNSCRCVLKSPKGRFVTALVQRASKAIPEVSLKRPFPSSATLCRCPATLRTHTSKSSVT